MCARGVRRNFLRLLLTQLRGERMTNLALVWGSKPADTGTRPASIRDIAAASCDGDASLNL